MQETFGRSAPLLLPRRMSIFTEREMSAETADEVYGNDSPDCFAPSRSQSTVTSGRDNGERVRPAKAGMFSGRQSHRSNSQELRSLGCIRGGNEADEANRQSHPRDGERVIGP